eukprot:2743075-Rhodomonas_salina.1
MVRLFSSGARYWCSQHQRTRSWCEGGSTPPGFVTAASALIDTLDQRLQRKRSSLKSCGPATGAHEPQETTIEPISAID